MPSTLTATAPETRQQKLPSPSGVSAKAERHAKVPESSLRSITKDVLQRGKQAAAATEIGISEGRLSAKLGDGTLSLGELEKLDVSVVVTIAEEVLKTLGPLSTPQARARQLIRSIRQELDELAQFMEHIA
jgi:hypothetical protein